MGEGVPFFSHLYAYFIGLIFAVFNESVQSIILCQSVLSAISCFMLYKIVHLLWNERIISFISIILYLLYGPLLFYDCLVLKPAINCFGYIRVSQP